MDHSQRVAARTALAVLAADGFLLAGGQALIEHGITERLSDDIDLFALHRRHTPATFTALVQKMTAALEASGYTAEVTRQYEEFASVTVGHDEQAVVIDLGLEPALHPPATDHAVPTTGPEPGPANVRGLHRQAPDTPNHRIHQIRPATP
jgi:hypothetical protein